MKILVVTPLFPPDIAPAAVYVKELLTHLGHTHTLTLMHYGTRPELVAGVRCVSISKQASALRRSVLLLTALRHELPTHDVVLLQNGPSVELPAVLALRLSKTPMIYSVSDATAAIQSATHPFKRLLVWALHRRSSAVITPGQTPALQKPLIHPLREQQLGALATYKATWQQHGAALEQILDTIV